MNQLIQLLVKAKTIYLLLSLLIICILTDFTYLEYIGTDELRQKYREQEQAQQEAEVYSDHDDLMADFKNDLAEIETEEVSTGSAYWDDIYFNLFYVSILPIASCLTICFLIFIGFHFTDEYSRIPFGNILKTSLFAYAIFPLSDLLICIWFGLIQTEYQMTDIFQMHSILNPSIQNFMESPKEYQWYNYLFSDMNLQNLIFILLIPLFLKNISDFRYIDLLKKMSIPFLGFFIVVHIVSPYTIYLCFLFD